MTIIESCVRNAAELRMSVDRPFVTLSYTQSLDGCIAARPGEPFDIAGSESQERPDARRGRHDAVIPGIGTVLAWNPDVGKLPDGEVRPPPVIPDSRLRMSASGDMLKGAGGRVSIRRTFERLKEFGVCSVIVEGGSHILTSFLMSRPADFAVLTIVPVFVGGLRAVSDLNQSDPECLMRIREPGHHWFGKDLIGWGPLA